MADPTAANRQALANAASALVPNNSPLGQSLAANQAAIDEQMAIEEANNLVMQREPVALPSEAQQFVDPATALPPQAPAAMPAQTPVSNALADIANAPAQSTVEQAAMESDAAQVAPPPQSVAPGAPKQAPSEYEKAAAAIEAQAKKTEADFAAKQKDINDKLEAAQKDYSAASKNGVDPGGAFSNMNVWQKVGLALAAGFSKGLTGYNPLEGIIERDIAAQKANIADRKDNAKGKINLYERMLGSLKDEKAAAEATRGAMYDAAKLRLEGIAQSTKNEQIKQDAQLKAQEYELKKQESNAKVQGLLATAQEKQGQMNYAKDVAKSDPIMAKILQLNPKQQKPLLEAKEVYDATEAAKQYIDKAFNDAKDIGVSGLIPFTDAKTTMDSLNAGIESSIRATMKGQGTIQEAEIERLVKPFLIAPSDSTSRRKIKQYELKQLLQSKNEGQIGILRSFGFLPKQLKTLKKK